MQATRTSKAAAILAILVLSVVILVYGKPFFIPLAFAALLSMLLLPVTRWLQAKGVGKALSILLSILLLAAFIAIVVFFVSWQVSGITENASKIEQHG